MNRAQWTAKRERQSVQRLKAPTRRSAWPMIARCMWRQWMGLPSEFRIKIVDLTNRPEDAEQDLSANLAVIYNRLQAQDIGRSHRSCMEYSVDSIRMANMNAPIMSIKEELWLTKRP